MSKGRILYVDQEIIPFSEETAAARFNRQLPAFMQEIGREVRVFMPRFNDINERKNQLHEVIRLSGMNLTINNCDHQLIIKVGSIPTARMQVYFIDNEEYFSRRGGALDEGMMVDDNDERMLFFGRGTLEAVRKLSWQPHLIHFTGWFCSMIPFYLRRINKENTFFNGTKTVITLTGDRFDGKVREELEKKMKADGATAKDLRIFTDLDYVNLMKAAITYANGVVIASPDVDPELVKYAQEHKRTIINYNPDFGKEDGQKLLFAQINKMYDSLIGKNVE